MEWIIKDSPIGFLKISATDKGINSLEFSRKKFTCPQTCNGHLLQASTQLDEYFAGKRKAFSLELDLSGTDFQASVWQTLNKIPYGTLWSYQKLAIAIKNPKAVRAVGGANNKNPIPVIIPCHRVIGKNGSLTGFGGGLKIKQWLLAHEGHQIVEEYVLS